MPPLFFICHLKMNISSENCKQNVNFSGPPMGERARIYEQIVNK
jgi:hypothetical protein